MNSPALNFVTPLLKLEAGERCFIEDEVHTIAVKSGPLVPVYRAHCEIVNCVEQ